MVVETHVRGNGAWRKAKDISVRIGGNWVSMREKWVKSGGVWRLVFSKGFSFDETIVNGYDYNVYNRAFDYGWDGTSPVTANITVVGTLGSSRSTTIDWQGYLDIYPDLWPG